jgi:hypothetical protein
MPKQFAKRKRVEVNVDKRYDSIDHWVEFLISRGVCKFCKTRLLLNVQNVLFGYAQILIEIVFFNFHNENSNIN